MTLFELKRTKKEMFHLRVFFWIFLPIAPVGEYLVFYPNHPRTFQRLAIFLVIGFVLAGFVDWIIGRYLRRVNAKIGSLEAL